MVPGAGSVSIVASQSGNGNWSAAPNVTNTFNVTKHVWKADADGKKQRVASERVVRPWYWRDGDALQMVVRYGAKVLELSKGKKAISVTTLKDVPTVIGTVLAAVKAGELDAAIEAVVGTRTPKLKKKAG